MKSKSSLKTRRSLAAKRGWETRRNQAATAPSNQQQITDKNSALNNGSFPSPEEVRAAFFDGLNRAHREREAQSKHPGSPEHVGSLQPEVGLSHPACHVTETGPQLLTRLGMDAAKWCAEMHKRGVVIGDPAPGEQFHAWMCNAIMTAYDHGWHQANKDEMGAKSEARSEPELLLTEGMRVKDDIGKDDAENQAKSTLWQRLKSAFQNLARMS